MAGPQFFAYNSTGASAAGVQTTYGTTAALLIPVAFGPKHTYAGMTWFPSPDQSLGFVFAKSVPVQNFPDAMHTYAWRDGSGLPGAGQITSNSNRVFGTTTTTYLVSKTQINGATAVLTGDYVNGDPLWVGCYLGTTNKPGNHSYVISGIADAGTHYSVDVISGGGDVGNAEVNGTPIYFGGFGTVEFWRSAGFTSQAFVNSVNYLIGSNYNSSQTVAAAADITSQGYWTTGP
jgi:hypothetical protein